MCSSSEEEGQHVEAAVQHFSQMLLLSRLRTHGDRQHLGKLFEQCWGTPLPLTPTPELCVTPTSLQLGCANLPRADLHPEQHAAGMPWPIVLLWVAEALDSVGSHVSLDDYDACDRYCNT